MNWEAANDATRARIGMRTVDGDPAYAIAFALLQLADQVALCARSLELISAAMDTSRAKRSDQ